MKGWILIQRCCIGHSKAARGEDRAIEHRMGGPVHAETAAPSAAIVTPETIQESEDIELSAIGFTILVEHDKCRFRFDKGWRFSF